MTLIFLFTLCLLLAILILVLGYIFGRLESHPELQEQVVEKIQNARISPKTYGTKVNDVPSGVIERPTAYDLAKENESPLVKGEKEAISESLATDPELIKAKEEYERLQNL